MARDRDGSLKPKADAGDIDETFSPQAGHAANLELVLSMHLDASTLQNPVLRKLP